MAVEAGRLPEQGVVPAALEPTPNQAAGLSVRGRELDVIQQPGRVAEQARDTLDDLHLPRQVAIALRLLRQLAPGWAPMRGRPACQDPR